MLNMAVSAIPMLAQMMDEHMDWNNGWAWLWMSLVMAAGVILVVVVVSCWSAAAPAGFIWARRPRRSHR